MSLIVSSGKNSCILGRKRGVKLRNLRSWNDEKALSGSCALFFEKKQIWRKVRSASQLSVMGSR